MKPELDRNALVTVRPQSAEEPEEVQALFEGAYLVRVGAEPLVSFVPFVDRKAGDWPPGLPDDPDKPRDAQQARRMLLATSAFAVTPSAGRVGTRERLTRMYPDVPPPVVFYVDDKAFSTFEHELAELAERTGFVTSGIPVSEVADRQVVRYLLEHVFESSTDSG